MDDIKQCEWFFSESPKNQDLGPNDAKFEIFKPDINSLVRESIQNSMDAVDDDSIPVRMSFKIRSFQRNSFPKFFELERHIKGCLDYWGEDAKNVFNPIQNALQLSSGKDRLYYIEVSDSNTSGMDYELGNNKTKFHGFLHSTGASNKKSANSGGSFGIGKAAYFAMSPLRSVLVSTMTQEGVHTFQGVSMLCTHIVNDVLRTPIGFYSTNNENPVVDVDEIPYQFKRTEPGTSINIMGVQITSQDDKADIYKEIKIAVLRNFWLAIYNDRLDVVVGDETIDSSNIIQLVEQYFPELSDNRRKGNVNPRPYLELVANAKRDDKRYMLIEDNLPHLGDVKLYIHRHPEGRGTIQYFRMPNMMVKREKLSAANNFFSVFICDNPEGDKKLKKLETVAHDDWDARNWKPREIDGSVSKEAKAIIEELEVFIRESIDAAFGNSQQDTMEIAGLDKYLYIPTASDNDSLLSTAEALMSEPTGDFKEDGVSPTTVMNGEPQKTEVKTAPISVGKVFIGTPTKASADEKGGLHSGTGKRHKPRPDKDDHVIPGEGRKNKEDNAGIDGDFSKEVDVTYRGIAQKEKGHYYHYLKINSPEDIENGRIVISTGREFGGSEPLNIIETSDGQTRRNSIYNLKLKKGSNTLIIRFADNLSHTLTLDVYEDKR